MSVSSTNSQTSVSNFPATQPVSAASLPLPAGAAQDGTDISSPTPMPAGGAGIRGWLSAIWTKLNGSLAVTGTFWQATQPVSAASLPLPSGAAADGTDATGVTMPTGGVGIRGWLSSIYNKLNTSVAVTGTFYQATQPVSGSVSVSNFPATQSTDVVDRSGRLLGTISNPVNTTASGTFTAADAVVAAPVGDGTLVSGASTAGSVIALQIPDGFQAWTTLLTGYSDGVVYTEASIDSTTGTDGNWIDLKGRKTGTAPGIESSTYAQNSNGYYRGNAAGFKWFRCRFKSGSVFPAVRIYLSNGQGATFLNSSIPGGVNNIGLVSAVQSGTWSITGDELQRMLLLQLETLRQTTKLVQIMSATTGVFIEDDVLDPSIL